MLINGKALAENLLTDVTAAATAMSVPPHLTVFTCAPNFETQKFLALKQKQAARCGITLVLQRCEPNVTLGEITAAIEQVRATTDGIIIQFPFPEHLSTGDLIALIPRTHDVDAFFYDGLATDLLPPVVGAIDEISRAHLVVWTGKKVVIVGNGRLVGAPATVYAHHQGGEVTVITKDSPDQVAQLVAADILILGAGVPGLITVDNIKTGVIIFDAGTSEAGGMLVGDADQAVQSKAALVTPVPGGIGPLTIAVLLRNVLYLAQEHRKNLHNMV